MFNEKLKKSVAAGLICILTVFSLSACVSGRENIPVVTFDGSKLAINGKVVAETHDRIYINRIDSSAVSISLQSTVAKDGSVNIVNVDPDGNEIKLSDVITDRDLYEAAALAQLNQPKSMMRDSVYIGPEVDRDAMEEVLCSYDKAMTLPFIMGDTGIAIIYTEDSGASESVSFEYESGIIDERFVPGDGVFCHPWMTGRVGTGISGMMKDEYSDHWAENSLEIDNYNGHTYYWFCVAYKDENDNKTYYSVVAEQTDSGRKMICSQRVDGSFTCCNIEEFSRILEDQ